MDSCIQKAEAKNHSIIGLKNNGWCYTGPIGIAYDKYGNATKPNLCNQQLGGDWENIVYKKKGVVDESKWDYRGCFKETVPRILKNKLGNV